MDEDVVVKGDLVELFQVPMRLVLSCFVIRSMVMDTNSLGISIMVPFFQALNVVLQGPLLPSNEATNP